MTAVADAIRTKAGSSESLAFPDGFVSAVEGITTGGGEVAESEWVKLSKWRIRGNITDQAEGAVIEQAEWDEIGNPTYIEEYAFKNCIIDKLVVPETITSVRMYAFSGCKGSVYRDGGSGVGQTMIVPEFIFEGENKTYGEAIFETAYLGGWPQGFNVSTIPDHTFQNSWILSDEFIVPEGVSIIGNGSLAIMRFILPSQANSGTYTTGKIILPSTVTAIEGYYTLFTYESKDGATLELKSTSPPTLNSSAMYYGPARIVVPEGTLDAYKTATNWSKFADIMEEATE